MKNKFITVISVMFFMMLICLIPNCFALEGDDIIPFKDQDFKNFFIVGEYWDSTYYDKNGDGEMSVNEMSQITHLPLYIYSTDFSPLQYAESLESLFINDVEISDLSNLSEILATLPNFEELQLSNNNLTDISSLNKITNLKELRISDSKQLVDISGLKDLTNLETLNIYNCSLEDVSVVSNFTNLKILSVPYNKIKAIPDLSKITAFNDIDIYNQYGSYNILVDFYENELTDISGLENTILETLELSYNKISDLSTLATMPNLKILRIYSNEITDISKLPTTLKELLISNNNVSDISCLKNFTDLSYLYISNNKITDASSLSNLTNLISLGLDNNQITSLTLKDMPNLSSISCMNNNLEKVTFENLPALSSVSLNNNNISDISSLTGLEKAYILNLSTNPISDISPISSTTAKYIYLIDTLVNPYNEATFHIMCTWEENGQKLYLGDYSQFVPSNEEIYTTEEIEEVTVDGEEVTVMPVDASTGIDELLTESSFPVIDTYTIKVLDASGEEKDTTEKIGSRNVIQILDENNEVLVEYVVVVKGDVTGNGYSKIYDAFKILKDILMPGVELDAIDTMIRDYNDDGLVRMYDSFQFLKASILG